MGHIYDVMDILYTAGKDKFMHTVERFHIYKGTRKNNQINDKNTVKPNAIFDAITPKIPEKINLPRPCHIQSLTSNDPQHSPQHHK
jgi:hypothetical protein